MNPDAALAPFEQAWRALDAEVRALPEERFLAPLRGWTARGIVAHLIGWNRHMIEASRSILSGETPAYYADAPHGYRNLNAAHAAVHSSLSRDELLHELDASLLEFKTFVQSGGEHADLASTIAFSLAKQKKQSPVLIAKDLAAELAKDPALQGITIEAKGPYINFIFGAGYVSQALREAVKPGYGSFPKNGSRVVLEHTSANPNGPLHVGHIRNSIIGDTLARVFRKAGYQLEVQYYSQ